MTKRIHIIKRGERWAVKKQGNQRATRKYDTKKDAILGASSLHEQGYDLIIHKKDGSIERWQKAK